MLNFRGVLWNLCVCFFLVLDCLMANDVCFILNVNTKSYTHQWTLSLSRSQLRYSIRIYWDYIRKVPVRSHEYLHQILGLCLSSFDSDRSSFSPSAAFILPDRHTESGIPFVSTNSSIKAIVAYHIPDAKTGDAKVAGVGEPNLCQLY